MGNGERYDDAFIDAFREAEVNVVAALPESLFRSLYLRLQRTDGITYVAGASELDLPGIAVGAYLGGKRAVIVMENSGLRQACEPLARLSRFGLPMVILMPFRGDLGEPNWWGHSHRETMEPILDALRIPFWHVRRVADIRSAVTRAFTHSYSSMFPVALIFGDECVESLVKR